MQKCIDCDSPKFVIFTVSTKKYPYNTASESLRKTRKKIICKSPQQSLSRYLEYLRKSPVRLILKGVLCAVNRISEGVTPLVGRVRRGGQATEGQTRGCPRRCTGHTPTLLLQQSSSVNFFSFLLLPMCASALTRSRRSCATVRYLVEMCVQ